MFGTFGRFLRFSLPFNAGGETVYMAVGEFGEASFSDVATTRAQSVDIAPLIVTSWQEAQTSAQVEEMLRLAEELAASREVRTRQRVVQRAAVTQETIPHEDLRYADEPRGYWLGHRPRHHDRTPQTTTPPMALEPQPFSPAFSPRPPAFGQRR